MWLIATVGSNPTLSAIEIKGLARFCAGLFCCVFSHSAGNTKVFFQPLRAVSELFSVRLHKAHPSFCVLRQTAMPAVLVETGFIDSEDVNLLTRHGDDIARALARGVTDYANFLASA